MASSCALAYSLLLTGPALALLYASSVLGFLSCWHECGWSAMNGALAVRTAVVIAAAASAVALCRGEAPLEAVIPVAAVFFAVSAWMIRQTRLYHVEGGPAPKFDPEAMKGKVVLVSGANSGIGKETVRQLVSLGATVILGCRSEARAQEAMDDIRAGLAASESSHLKKSTELQMRFIPLDLSDLGSVRQAAQFFIDMKLPLDVLINNAGVMMGTKKLTKDGLEITMQANHLGHFLLTLLLLPKLQEADDGRVVNITSSTYVLTSKGIDLDDLFCECNRKYSMFSQYAQSKLANILFTKELARRYKKLKSFAVHPGLVRTDVVRNMPWYLRYPNIIFAFALATLQKTPPQGAHTSVWCAAIKDSPANGSFLINRKPYKTADFANSEADARKLWELSEKLVGITRQ